MKLSLKKSLLGIAAMTMSVGGILTATESQVNAATVRPTVFVRFVTKLYTRDGKLIGNRALGPYTSWAVGKIGFIQGARYYQVATNEYVKAGDGQIINDTNHDVPLSNYKPDANKINDYFVKYVNALHAANGTAPVHTTSDFINYANERAAQQSAGNLNHTTASRDTSENLSTGGLNYMRDNQILYGYITSDKQLAYYLLKSWYGDEYNPTQVGKPGHFGHRAALIYSGPTVALGISDTAAAYDADWDYSTYDQFDALYNYTGSNPNTKFISEDAVQ